MFILLHPMHSQTVNTLNIDHFYQLQHYLNKPKHSRPSKWHRTFQIPSSFMQLCKPVLKTATTLALTMQSYGNWSSASEKVHFHWLKNCFLSLDEDLFYLSGYFVCFLVRRKPEPQISWVFSQLCPLWGAPLWSFSLKAHPLLPLLIFQG